MGWCRYGRLVRTRQATCPRAAPTDPARASLIIHAQLSAPNHDGLGPHTQCAYNRRLLHNPHFCDVSPATLRDPFLLSLMSVTTARAVLPTDRRAERVGNATTIPIQIERGWTWPVGSRPWRIKVADPGESQVTVDTNARSVKRSAGLSLPIGDGVGQQLSCRCCRCDTAHGTGPRRKTVTVASGG